MPLPSSDLPDDLLAALRRLHAERPGTWIEIVADTVVAVGGADSADLLALSADRAASGYARDDEPGDPEQALAEMEAELRADAGKPPPSAHDMDLLAHLPPVAPPGQPPPRSMDN